MVCIYKSLLLQEQSLSLVVQSGRKEVFSSEGVTGSCLILCHTAWDGISIDVTSILLPRLRHGSSKVSLNKAKPVIFFCV